MMERNIVRVAGKVDKSRATVELYSEGKVGGDRSMKETSTGLVFFLMRRRPPRSTPSRSSAASDVYTRPIHTRTLYRGPVYIGVSLIHISVA